MTIHKGEDWGFDAPLPAEGRLANDDAAARNIVEAARRAGQEIPPIGLLGGDLWRALGAPVGGEERLRSSAARTVAIDLGEVLIDGRIHWFLSHMIIRNSWWRGRVVAAMNAEWCGSLRFSPRAHPNDGKLEILDGNPSFGQRWLARPRLRTGDHLPHPSIAVTRASATQFELVKPTRVFLDGLSVGRASTISVRLEPDAVTVVF